LELFFTNVSEFHYSPALLVKPVWPFVRHLADARKAGMTEEELDAAVDVIAAVDAGVLQSLNQRVKARNKQ
jgi:hypothetical protein